MTTTRVGVWQLMVAHLIWGAMPLFVVLTIPASGVESALWRAVGMVAITLDCVAVSPLATYRELRGQPRRSVLWSLVAGGLLAAQWAWFAWLVLEGLVLDATVGLLLRPVALLIVATPWSIQGVKKIAFPVGLSLVGIGCYILSAGVIPVAGLMVTMLYVAYVHSVKHTMNLRNPVLAMTIDATWIGLAAIPVLAYMAMHGSWSFAHLDSQQTLVGHALGLGLYALIAIAPWVLLKREVVNASSRVVAATSIVSPLCNAIVGIGLLGAPWTWLQVLGLGCLGLGSLYMATTEE